MSRMPEANETADVNGGRGHLALFVLCLTQLNVVLSFQGTTVSLPEIQRSLALSSSATQWLVSANALAFGGLLLAAGRAADVYGHRRVFLWGVALFGAASLLGGMAPSIAVLMVARVAQGVGAALFTPATLALVADLFPEGPARRRALAWWGGSGPLGGVLAILIGGALASTFGWRAVFLMGAPIAFAQVALALRYLPGTASRSKARLDLPGAAAGAIGIALLVYGLGSIGSSGRSSAVLLGAVVAGGALLWLFWRNDRTDEAPLIPRSLYGRPEMWRAIGVGFFHGAAINTPIIFYALYMQRYRDGSPWEIGIGFLPCNAAIIGASLGGARLAAWIGYRLMMAAGMAAVMGGVWWLTTISVDGRYAMTILPGWILFGLGVGAAQIGIVGAATDDAPPSARGVVGGLVNTTGQVGTAVGLALLTVVSSQFASDLDGYRAAFVTGGTLALAGVILSMLPVVRRGEAGSMATCREEERAGA